MNLLDILNTFTEQIYLFLILITDYIIGVIIIKVSKKGISKIINFIARGVAGYLAVSTISMLITIYSYIVVVNSFVSSLANIVNIHISGTVSSLLLSLAITSLGASILLGIAILFMESERFVSPLIKEIENANINNLGKTAIRLLDIALFILSIILVYSILLLAIFPTNMTLINTIINISQLYIYIITFNIIGYITVFTLNNISKLTNEQANYKDLLRNNK
jgi:hypothetical protein